MNLYEHTIVVRQDVSTSQIKQITGKYSKIVEKNDGDLVKTESWGLLNLSYIIKKNKAIVGICLGAQLIAKSYGSKISKSKKKF